MPPGGKGTVDVEAIRSKIRRKDYSIYGHAFTEAFKDGLSIDDLIYTALNGEVIEEYPERARCLLYAMLPTKIPVHIVIDYGWEDEFCIVTAYIPDDREWINFQIRRL